MKKLFLISVLLLSFNGWAENYSCRINEVFKGSNGQLDGVVTNRSAKKKVGSKFEVNYDTCEFNGQRFDTPIKVRKSGDLCLLTIKSKTSDEEDVEVLQIFDPIFFLTEGKLSYVGRCRIL
jgi:hypothetical protein|tara:strand:+ start:680 stop:1042 length:363 start_codon:yes stop_codon:yes gene_type:complete